jgi:hypothetical protein
MAHPRTIAAVCITALAGAAGLASNAAAQANCETYGRLALQQQQQNADSKCGFTGPEWSPDLKAHIAWCGGVGPDQWKVQLQKRKQQLDACKAK